jgi:hypothetical protein
MQDDKFKKYFAQMKELTPLFRRKEFNYVSAIATIT